MTTLTSEWFCRATLLLLCGSGLLYGCGEPGAIEPTAIEAVAPRRGVVHLAPAAIAAAEITVGQVERTALTGVLVIPAEIQLDPARTAHVAPLVSGRLREVRVTLGQEVALGEILGTLVSADAAALAAATLDARARLAVAEAATARLAPLGESGVASRRTLLEAESDRARARAELAGLTQRQTTLGARGGQVVTLVAPLAGVIVDLHAVPGETVQAGDMVFTVADTHHLWAMGAAPERSIATLEESVPATVRVQAYPGESFRGQVTLLAPTLREATRTLDVRVELEADPTGHLRPGLFGSVSLESGDGVLVVPEGALSRMDATDIVFVPGDGEGDYRAVPVALGRRTGGLAEVVHGLTEGDAVVTRGAFILKSELLRAELMDEN